MFWIHILTKGSCIVLTDEYDVPIQKAIFNSGKDIDKIVIFIREFISNLSKLNEFVERVLINACVGLAEVISADADTHSIHIMVT